MSALLGIFIGLLAVTALLALVLTKLMPNASQGKDAPEEGSMPDEECCGAHEVCELDLGKLSEKVVYFADEELDAFKEMEESAFTDEHIEEFREVLYTLKKAEIKDWLHSLELRRINLPDAIKPEVRLMLSD